MVQSRRPACRGLANVSNKTAWRPFIKLIVKVWLGIILELLNFNRDYLSNTYLFINGAVFSIFLTLNEHPFCWFVTISLTLYCSGCLYLNLVFDLACLQPFQRSHRNNLLARFLPFQWHLILSQLLLDLLEFAKSCPPYSYPCSRFELGSHCFLRCKD